MKEWALHLTGSLVTGNELIDTQHRELISRRINWRRVRSGNGKENRGGERSIFAGLYGLPFFRGGRRSRKRAGIRSFRPTTGSMKNLKRAVEELRIMLEEEEGPSEAFVEAVRKNVEEWLQNHIMSWDKEVAGYAERNRAVCKDRLFLFLQLPANPGLNPPAFHLSQNRLKFIVRCWWYGSSLSAAWSNKSASSFFSFFYAFQFTPIR